MKPSEGSNPVGQEKTGFSKELRMSLGKSKEKSILERKNFSVNWVQGKRDIELDGTDAQGIMEPRGYH